MLLTIDRNGLGPNGNKFRPPFQVQWPMMLEGVPGPGNPGDETLLTIS